jgi:hypothetical protein
MGPTRSAGVPNLATARIIWAALVVGVVLFLAVVLFVVPPQSQPDGGNVLLWVAAGLTAVNLPLAWIVRSTIHARARGANDRVAPGVWFTGNLVHWALCEGAAFFGAVVTMLSEERFPALVVPLVALGGLLLGYPTGSDLEEGPDGP